MDAGSVIGGFRIERLLGGGSFGAVYEATQLSLARTVALRLVEGSAFADPALAARFRRQQHLAASVHHPSIVPTYEAGDWEGGKFVATRYVRGRTLADLLEHGSLRSPRLEDILASIAGALAAAHAAGLVHGAVTPRNVLVDAAGAAFLADLGLGRAGSFEADRAALAAMASAVERSGGRGRRRFLAPALAGSAALAVLAAAAVLATGGADGGDQGGEPAPPVAAGAVPIGSALTPGPADAVGCDESPGPNTPACTLSQSSIAGQPMTVRKDGVIRAWAVRGAAGDLALQVVGRRGGRTVLRGFSQVERVADPGPHAFQTSVLVERGDRVGVLLAPGAVIGTRTGPAGSAAVRWQGTLPYTGERLRPSPFDGELLLRADVELGARLDLPQRTGSHAADARPGPVLGEAVIELGRTGAVRVALVGVGDGIAMDAFRGERRLARIDVPDLSPDGRLLELDGSCGFRRGFCLRWLNDGDQLPVIHAYRLARGDSAFEPIG